MIIIMIIIIIINNNNNNNNKIYTYLYVLYLYKIFKIFMLKQSPTCNIFNLHEYIFKRNGASKI